MFDVEQIIEKVRLRPSMYIGWHSIYALKVFLSGYETSLYENFNWQSESESLCFGHWVEYRYKINNSFWPWPRILHHVAGNEDKALDLFFELWPLYLKERDSFKITVSRMSFDYPKDSVTNEMSERFHDLGRNI